MAVEVCHENKKKIFERVQDRSRPNGERAWGYAEAVQNRIGGYNFEHAETVAKKMRAVFDGADYPNIQVLALKATMVAAVSLNRFAAMEVFDKMLMEVRSNELAAPVAEMLRENADYFRFLQGRVPDGKLHAAIRQIELPEEQRARDVI